MNSEITREELETSLRDRSPLVLVEALPAPHFLQGHLPGALNLPLDGFVEGARALLPDRDADIVVYCSGPTCQNSHNAKRMLDSLGYSRVRVFAGGKSAWKDAGNPLDSGV
jgi:rhodanese-related sulfurtransferase